MRRHRIDLCACWTPPGKLPKKLVRPRLQTAIIAAGDLSERQYGLRTGRSTVHAIQEVVRAARNEERGNHSSRPVCLLVALDVKNAFNSVRWVEDGTRRKDLTAVRWLDIGF